MAQLFFAGRPGDAKQFLASRGKNIDATDLTDEFAIRQASLTHDAEAATGSPFLYSDMYRPDTRQAQYYSNKIGRPYTYKGVTYRPQGPSGRPAAMPGPNAPHMGNAADAADVNSPAYKWARQHQSEYGIQWANPGRPGWDEPHFQLAGARTPSTPGGMKDPQSVLASLGYAANGVVGAPEVMQFQRDHGLTPDGKIGPQTRGALVAAAGMSQQPNTLTARAGLTPSQLSSLMNPDQPPEEAAARTPDFSITDSPDYTPPSPVAPDPHLPPDPALRKQGDVTLNHARTLIGNPNFAGEFGPSSVAPVGEAVDPGSAALGVASFPPVNLSRLDSSAAAARTPADTSGPYPTIRPDHYTPMGTPTGPRNINFNKQRPAIKGDDVAFVQEQLKSAGYYDGRVDGIGGPMTRDAFKRYQQDHPGIGTSLNNTLTGKNKVPDGIYGPQSQRSLAVVKGPDLPDISPPRDYTPPTSDPRQFGPGSNTFGPGLSFPSGLGMPPYVAPARFTPDPNATIVDTPPLTFTTSTVPPTSDPRWSSPHSQQDDLMNPWSGTPYMQSPVYAPARDYISPGNGDRTDMRTVYSDPTLSPVSASPPSDVSRTSSGPGTDSGGFWSPTSGSSDTGGPGSSSGSGITSRPTSNGYGSPSDTTPYSVPVSTRPKSSNIATNTYQDSSGAVYPDYGSDNSWSSNPPW